MSAVMLSMNLTVWNTLGAYSVILTSSLIERSWSIRCSYDGASADLSTSVFAVTLFEMKSLAFAESHLATLRISISLRIWTRYYMHSRCTSSWKASSVCCKFITRTFAWLPFKRAFTLSWLSSLRRSSWSAKTVMLVRIM